MDDGEARKQRLRSAAGGPGAREVVLIPASEIVLCKRPDGSDFALGEGMDVLLVTLNLSFVLIIAENPQLHVKCTAREHQTGNDPVTCSIMYGLMPSCVYVVPLLQGHLGVSTRRCATTCRRWPSKC
jgi:hypothetical protein